MMSLFNLDWFAVVMIKTFRLGLGLGLSSGAVTAYVYTQAAVQAGTTSPQ